jgi:NAD(P)-dependent dehydrogenase (short-subunit alcohol dehydrogenase family)
VVESEEALITGATRDLGLEIARGIPGAFPAPFDIADLGRAAAIDEIVARHGQLDCLVNNAVAGAPKIRRHVRRGVLG